MKLMTNALLFVFYVLMFDFCFANQNAQLARLDDKTATGALTETQDKNVHGHREYSGAAAVLGKQSMIYSSHGGECATSCPGGCCGDADGLLAQGAMYAMLNMRANQQAKEHRQAAMEACTAFNQLSSSQKDCKGEISPLDNFVPQASWYNDDGGCTDKAAPECKIMDEFEFNASYNRKNVSKNCGPNKNQSCRSPSLHFSQIKTNPDGSVEVKQGNSMKKMTMDMLNDAQKLKAAGFSPLVVASITSEFKEAMANLQRNNILGGGISTGKTSMASVSPQMPQSPEAAPIAPVKQDLTLREPASPQEFYKSINGDPIGMPNEDIFKMINRRYIKVYEVQVN